MIRDWWSDRYNERFWLEVTGRLDLGANLKAPQGNEQGKDFWSYSLLHYVSPGDMVFHYSRPEQAIVALSVATGELWEDSLVWAARGTSARTAGIQPHSRSGWYLGLESFALLQHAVGLDEIRSEHSALVGMREDLSSMVGGPTYFPFELSKRRPLRPMQGYLFKLPRFFVEHFPAMTRAIASKKPGYIAEAGRELGNTYRQADQYTSAGERDPFFVDPALVERALHSHAVTQNALAAYLGEQGFEPRSPHRHEPNYDLAWRVGSTVWVAEIKSLTEANEEKQLRLGLGQLLRYRQLLASNHTVRAVLVTERQPKDPTWETLCETLGVSLVWPDNWQNKLLKTD